MLQRRSWRPSQAGCAVQRRKFIGIAGCAAVALLGTPLAAWAQQAGKVYRIGYLALLPGRKTRPGRSRCFSDCRSLVTATAATSCSIYRSAEGRVDRLAELAAELVRSNPDVLISGFGTLAPKALIATTKSIPIVFASIGDPVGAGIVASLSEPGGNATGMSGQAADTSPKRLQLLRSLVPGKQDHRGAGKSGHALYRAGAATGQGGGRLDRSAAGRRRGRRADQVSAAIDEAVKSGAAKSTGAGGSGPDRRQAGNHGQRGPRRLPRFTGRGIMRWRAG